MTYRRFAVDSTAEQCRRLGLEFGRGDNLVVLVTGILAGVVHH